MQKLEIIPEDVGRYMEQSASQRGQNPPGMMPPNVGMMPGSNPMELLQMQQMQQMQQMFQNMSLPKWFWFESIYLFFWFIIFYNWFDFFIFQTNQ